MTSIVNENIEMVDARLEELREKILQSFFFKELERKT
jgi:hypothetical protein